MTLKEFLENPAGKGDSSMNRATLIDTLNHKYNTLVDSKSIKCRVYRKLGSHNEYFIHLVIPTETERDNTYDVVFHLINTDKEKKPVSSYDVKFFANTPSFAYTFLHVYYQNGLFEESLMHKFDRQFFKERPVERNRFGIINYDKYLYFGAKYVLDARMLSSGGLDLRSISYAQKLFDSKIRSFDRIMNEYNKAKRKLERESKKDNKNASSTPTRTVEKGTGRIVPKAPKTVNVKKPVKPNVRKISKR